MEEGIVENVENVEVAEGEGQGALSRYSSPTFSVAQYEALTEYNPSLSFSFLELPVVRGEAFGGDGMFENFDKLSVLTTSKARQLECGKWSPVSEETGDTVDTVRIEQAELDAQLEAKYQEGLSRGREESAVESAEKISELEAQINERCPQIANELQTQIAEKFEEIEKGAFEFAINIARKILQTTIEAKPDYIFEVVRNGLRNATSAKPLKIRVSSKDYLRLQGADLPADIEASKIAIQYVADESVSSGCVIETDFGVIGLELDKIWQEMSSKLFEDLAE